MSHSHPNFTSTRNLIPPASSTECQTTGTVASLDTSAEIILPSQDDCRNYADAPILKFTQMRTINHTRLSQAYAIIAFAMTSCTLAYTSPDHDERSADLEVAVTSDQPADPSDQLADPSDQPVDTLDLPGDILDQPGDTSDQPGDTLDQAADLLGQDVDLLDQSDDILEEGTGDLGKWLTVTPTISTQYDSNIFNMSQNPESDMISIFTVDMKLASPEKTTNSWSVTYRPSYHIFANNSSLDGVDQYLNAKYTKRWAKTTWETNATYNSSSGSNRFVGGFTESNVYDFNSGVTYELSGKTRLSGLYTYTEEDFNDAALTDSATNEIGLVAMYDFSKKISLGSYLKYLHTSVPQGVDHSAYALGFTSVYQITGKTVITGYIGYEDRQFAGSNTEDRGILEYEIKAAIQATEKISFALSAYQHSRPSPTNPTDGYDATGLSCTCKYQATERLSIYGSAAYEITEYYSTLKNVSAGTRDANYMRLEVGAKYKLREHLTLNASINYSENDSKSSVASYDKIVAMVGVSYEF